MSVSVPPSLVCRVLLPGLDGMHRHSPGKAHPAVFDEWITMHERSVLLVAELGSELHPAIRTLAASAGLSLHSLSDPLLAQEWLESHNPVAVLVAAGLRGAREFCQHASSRCSSSIAPTIALARELTDTSMQECLSWGVDDVVAERASELERRLGAVAVHIPAVAPIGRGKAVVAEADPGRSHVVARVLANAGYCPEIARDLRDVARLTSQPDVRLVVFSAHLGPPRQLISSANDLGSKAAWVITSSPADIEASIESVVGLERVTAIGEQCPPENLLFVSNDLLRSTSVAMRKCTRVLFGTVVLFRAPGASRDDTGYTYNVSEGGMYVRTLAPPDSERVWLELRPPCRETSVRLEARVAWRRFYGDDAVATAPAGFGLEILGGLGNSVAVWKEGFAELTKLRRTAVVGQMLEDALSKFDPRLDAVAQVSDISRLIASVSSRPRAQSQLGDLLSFSGQLVSMLDLAGDPLILEPSAGQFTAATLSDPVSAAAPPAALSSDFAALSSDSVEPSSRRPAVAGITAGLAVIVVVGLALLLLATG